jgi:hypothetical protein
MAQGRSECHRDRTAAWKNGGLRWAGFDALSLSKNPRRARQEKPEAATRHTATTQRKPKNLSPATEEIIHIHD